MGAKFCNFRTVCEREKANIFTIFCCLQDKLNAPNFDRVLAVIWESSAHSLHDTISVSIEKGKPPTYFKTLLDILRVLINFFYGDKIPNDETLKKMEAQLQLYASDSHVLIARYFFDRYREQKVITDFPLGSVNIKVQLLREHLRVEVLNARHLKPPDPRSSKYSLHYAQETFKV